MKQREGWKMSCDVGKATEGLENELWRRRGDGKVREWPELIVIVIAELILQPFNHFTYVTIHAPTLPSLYLRHSSLSNPSVASRTPQFILQPFFRFSYVTSSSLTSPGMPPMIKALQAHSPSFVSLDLRHSSFSNPSVALPTSQLILQPLRCFTYVTAHSSTLLSLLLRHRFFTYVTWRAAL